MSVDHLETTNLAADIVEFLRVAVPAGSDAVLVLTALVSAIAALIVTFIPEPGEQDEVAKTLADLLSCRVDVERVGLPKVRRQP